MLIDLVAPPQSGAARAVDVGIDIGGLRDVPGLAGVPRRADGTVGPVLLAAHIAALDAADLTDAALLEVGVLWARLSAWTQAMQYALWGELTRRPEDSDEAVPQPAAIDSDGVLVRPHAADEVAAAMSLTVRGGESQVWTAIGLCDGLPATWQALASGRIDVPRALAMVDETGCLDDAGREQVEGSVLRGGRRDSPGRFRRAVRRTVQRVDAGAVKERAEHARAQTYVRTGDLGDATAWLDAHLAAEDAMAVRLALDAAAATLRTAGDSRTMDQLRAQALAAPFWAALATGDLATTAGPLPIAVAHGRHPALDLDVLPDEGVAELRGYGPVPADIAGALMTRSVDGPRPVVRVHERSSRAAADASEAWASEPGYRPSGALVRHVVDRDVSCRFPGCMVAARWCDVDHTVAWPAGPTHPSNLGLLCRRHHQYKQTDGVRLTQPRPGTFRWRLPTGREYETGPPV